MQGREVQLFAQDDSGGGGAVDNPGSLSAELCSATWRGLGLEEPSSRAEAACPTSDCSK